MTDWNDWDAHTDHYRTEAGGRWRSYCDRLHLAVIAAQGIPAPDDSAASTVYKTDLFDEAAGTGLAAGLADLLSVERVIGSDISAGVVTDAVRRCPVVVAPVGDLRSLPFRNGAFEVVVSNSSLDHFETRAELRVAIGELARVVRHGGRLLITLDNLASPVIALRALLPYRILRRLGILQYPVGVTLTSRTLRRELESVGFHVERTFTLMHVPRVLAIPWCVRADRRGRPGAERTVDRLLRWEVLGRLPTQHLTGHFVGAVARKP